jgi:hypothetical protein
MHFIRCQIMKIGEKEKIESISATAVWEGSGKIAGTIAAIKKLMGTLGSEAEACRSDSPAPFQTMQNKDNLDALSRSLSYSTWLIALSTDGHNRRWIDGSIPILSIPILSIDTIDRYY